MKATLTFKTKAHAETFARAWSRKTMSGHTIGAGSADVTVHIYEITTETKAWIDNYVNTINQ
jgi:hypothetical protein